METDRQPSSRPQWNNKGSRGRSPPRDIRFNRGNSISHNLAYGQGRDRMSRFDEAGAPPMVPIPLLEEQMKEYFESIKELLKDPIFKNPEPQPKPEPEPQSRSSGRGRGRGRPINSNSWQRH